MRYLVILILLAGCTSNNYVPVPHSKASNSSLSADLSYCKNKVINEYISHTDHLGAAIGGGFAGPIGGAVGGIIEGSENQTPKKDLNIEIENCMIKKGYIGTSSGYN